MPKAGRRQGAGGAGPTAAQPSPLISEKASNRLDLIDREVAALEAVLPETSGDERAETRALLKDYQTERANLIEGSRRGADIKGGLNYYTYDEARERVTYLNRQLDTLQNRQLRQSGGTRTRTIQKYYDLQDERNELLGQL